MVCNKKSVDGSGKANLIDSVGDVTWGVLYQMDEADLKRLDRIEGGYERTQVQVWQPDGHAVMAVTYVSSKLADDPVAYDWYKQHIVDGARNHQLPADYLDYLKQLPSRPDSTRT